MSYCGYITRIKDIRDHINADRLKVGYCFGNPIIIGLDIQEGQMGIYFPTDGKLGLEFAQKNRLIRTKDENGNHLYGYLDEEKRHVSTLKLRKEISDGLFLPLESLSSFTDISTLNEGDMVTTLNGVLICEKYVPRGKRISSHQNQPKKKIREKESFPYFEQHVDTSQLVYNTQSFKEGDICYITLKLHGTSARTSYSIKEKIMYLPRIIQKFIKLKNKKSWNHVSGTRRVVLKDYKGGFYGDNSFRKKWHDYFIDKLHKGESVFYEIVGYTEGETTIMAECDNKKTKDKEFIKKYGETTKFTYGCGINENDIYVYRMTMTNEDGYVFEYPTELVQLRCEQMGVKHVPVFEKFIFTTVNDLMERVNKYADGADPIGKSHIREGVIVRVDNKEKFKAYKHKNQEFKILEGIVKSDDILDIEEAESEEKEMIET